MGLAKSAGLILDPWEAWVLEQALGEREDGKWAAFEVGLIVSRQNGKGSILEARELAGLFLHEEPLIIHTAHQFNTSREAYRRIRALIEQTPNLDRQVKRFNDSHGEEGIELLKPTRRLQFLARSSGSGRGFSADTLIYDEAMPLDADDVAATLPALSARSAVTEGGPQVWYTASAGNRKSTQLARVRRRGMAGAAGVPDPTLAFMEWSIDPHADTCPPDCAVHDDPAAVSSYAKANPGLGYRLTVEACEREAAAMGGHHTETFGRERLGVGTYPADVDGWAVIPQRWWAGTLMTDAPRPRSPSFAVAVAPEHASAAIGVAGGLPDGRAYLEVPQGCHRPGTAWVLAEARRMDARWRPDGWVFDKRSAAGALIQSFEDAGLTVLTPTVTEIGQGCGQLYVAARDGQIGHADDRALRTALAGAVSRKLSGAWVWDDRESAGDMSPLIAVTLAHWGHVKFGGDYDAGRSVHYDLAEILRYVQMGVYDAADIARLYTGGLIDDEGLAELAAAGVQVPALLT